jgi:diamine N-acetyltransferase
MTVFRPVASAQDVALVAQLAREIWTEHYVDIVGRAQVDYMLATFQSEAAIARQMAKGQEYYLITHDGRPEGYLALVPQPAAGKLFLSKIYVRKAARGLGLGKSALAFAEQRCRDAELRTIWLTVNKHNTASIHWYERMGFRNAGPTVKDIGGGFIMDDFIMEKDVAAKGESPRR